MSPTKSRKPRSPETETLRAITSGQVDAPVVSGPQGEPPYTLKDADRSYRQITEQMAEGACTLNAQGIVVFANASLARLLGLPLERVLGVPLASWVRAQDQTRLAQLLEEARTGSAKGEIALISVTGESVPVQLSLRGLNAEQGPRLTAVFFDLRERQQNEQALRQTSENLEERVSERTAEMQSAYEELRVANEELAVVNRELANEVRVRRQAEEETRRLLAQAEQSRRALLSLLEDEKEAEREVRESEERYRALAEAAHNQIYIINRDGIVEYVNAHGARFLDIPPESMIGKPVASLFPAGVFREQQESLDRVLETGEPLHIERKIPFRDQVRWLDTWLVPLRDAQGKPRAVLGATQDITARKRVEEQLQQLNAELEERVRDRTAQLEEANRELESFAYSVSHDLRVPLRAIRGFASILLREHAAGLPAEVQRYLNLIHESAEQMQHLIEDILTLSRLSRQPLTIRPVQPVDLVKQALADLAAEQENRRVEISMGDLPECQADPALLKQVWINLLSNALKFTGKREVARIEIGALSAPDAPGATAEGKAKWVYFVRDNGAGFDMRYANKLFGVFQRLHSRAEFEGTGVGLANVQRIVHRHGGRIWAEGQVDQGATFYFTIPEP